MRNINSSLDHRYRAVAVGDTVSLGPDSLGAFTTTVVKSIQRKRVNVLHAEAGQSVSFGLKKIKRAGVRKGTSRFIFLFLSAEGGSTEVDEVCVWVRYGLVAENGGIA